MATTTVWAIGDLHLSIGLESEKQKPMDQFGASWVQHTAKIARSWCERVQAQDIVLLAGDIFWGNRVEEAQFALNWLGCLPGRKVLVRGNHDNWWQSIGKVRAALPPGMYAIQNDALLLDDVAISGARGWKRRLRRCRRTRATASRSCIFRRLTTQDWRQRWRCCSKNIASISVCLAICTARKRRDSDR